jgi:hypothetical protein
MEATHAPKRWFPTTKLHGATAQKTASIFAVKIAHHNLNNHSNPVFFSYFECLCHHNIFLPFSMPKVVTA